MRDALEQAVMESALRRCMGIDDGDDTRQDYGDMHGGRLMRTSECAAELLRAIHDEGAALAARSEAGAEGLREAFIAGWYAGAARTIFTDAIVKTEADKYAALAARSGADGIPMCGVCGKPMDDHDEYTHVRSEAGRSCCDDRHAHYHGTRWVAARYEAGAEGLDAVRMTHAWAILTAETNPDRWEPDRYNAAAFVTALLAQYDAIYRAALAETEPKP